MKRIISIFLVVLLVGGLFISCSNDVRQTESRHSISVSVAQEKELATDAAELNAVDVDELYWYYSAEKTSGAFVHGETGFEPVNADQDGGALAGLTGTELGEFSNGGWEFVFKAFFEEIEKSDFATADAVYTTTSTFTLEDDMDLVLYLEEGDAMPGNGFQFTEGVTFYAANLEDPTVARLYVYEGSTQIAGPIAPENQGALDDDGNLTFVSEDSYELSVGNHTVTFKITVPGENETLVVVGSEPIQITVGKGVTQTLSGPIADDDAHANVTVDGYATNYTVTFDVNGGDALGDNEMKVEEILKAEQFPTPERDGYEFAGWFTVVDGGTQATLASISNLVEDCTLYAHWTEVVNTVTVSFVIEDEYVEYIDPIDPIEIEYGAPFSFLANYGDDYFGEYGYEFDSWFSDSDMTEPVFSITVNTNTEDFCLYVDLEESIPDQSSIILSFDAIGYDSAATVYDGVISDVPSADDAELVALINQYNDENGTNYTFGGWYTNTNVQITNEMEYDVGEYGDCLYGRFK